MRLKRRIIITSLLVFSIGLLAVVFAADGVRLWIWWKARQEKLSVQIDKINAPFLRPIVLRDIRIRNGPDAAARFDIQVDRLTSGLNLKAILLGRGRLVQNLAADNVRIEVRQNHNGEAALSDRGWNTLQKLIPINFSVQHADVRVENGSSIVLVRSVTISGSEVEAGRFNAAELMIASPWLRQTFSNLRGATTWQDTRLTIAGLSLARGLDVQTVTADLSHLGKQHLGLEFDIDVFGGKVRASLTNEWRAHHANWNVAGSASDISLARTSEAIGFADRIDGRLHACKFTFRGNLQSPANAAASIWTELTGLHWRDRAAETIMLGLSLYNREIQLQQLYLKQSKNEFTLTGEGSLPKTTSGWLTPDFRGDISAAIGDLDQFAGLFGTKHGDFGGEIAIEGTMNARERNISGHLTVTGRSVLLFRSPIDVFTTRLNLKGSDLEIEELELHRQKDVARATGKIDLAHEHEYSGNATFTVANVGDYLRLIPFGWRNSVTQGAVNCTWSGAGKPPAHNGTFQINSHGVRIAAANLAPFDAELAGNYAPGNVFFRQFHLVNEHASLNGFVTIASHYLQLQALALDLDGKPKVRGNVFLPVNAEKLRNGGNLFDALEPDQKLDLDLGIEPTDVAQLCQMFAARPRFNGLFAGRFSIFGGVDALQGWGEVHLHDFFTADDPARSSFDGQLRLSSGAANASGSIRLRDSDPIACDAGGQLHVGGQAKHFIDPFWARFDFPKVAAANFPRALSHNVFREGIANGKLTIESSATAPKITGPIELKKARFNNPVLRDYELAAQLNCNGTSASIDAADITGKNLDVPLRGEIDFSNPNTLKIHLTSVRALSNVTPLDAVGCVGEILFQPGVRSGANAISDIFLTTDFGLGNTLLSFQSTLRDQNSQQTTIDNYPICFGDQTPRHTLLLGIETSVQKAPVRKKPRRR